ncbi:MAG: nucleotide exchange factor GrpE [Deltaproteobacteria bacterium]|nr:nucleotide exchange factor GrpE [Deltaproteobacteria bacterium]
MSEDPISELNQTLRKQGRAAIAAQAAAEETLAVLKRIEAKLDETREPAEPEVDGSLPLEDAVRSLLPYIDSLDRVASEARRLEATRTPWIARTFAAKREAELLALSQGVGMLTTQLGSLLATWGIELDRATGVELDPDRHRVVETRAPRTGEPGGTVVEVVRAGCKVNGRRVREADVAVTNEGVTHE